MHSTFQTYFSLLALTIMSRFNFGFKFVINDPKNLYIYIYIIIVNNTFLKNAFIVGLVEKNKINDIF